MKKSILLYLFILGVLFNIYTYVYLNKQIVFEQDRYERLKVHKNDSIQTLKKSLEEANYFTLKNNDRALDYFENKQTGEFYDADKLVSFVTESLLESNFNTGGNPYVGYDSLNGSKPIINKVSVINHRWVIAEFAMGDIWGEALIKYFINDDKTISFENAETVLHINRN